MTVEELRHFFGGKLCSFDEQTLVDMSAASEADVDEGVEWMPYYKAALWLLSGAVGTLTAIADNRSLDFREACLMHYRSMLLSGIGPRKDADVIRRCEEMASFALEPIGRPTKRVKEAGR